MTNVVDMIMYLKWDSQVEINNLDTVLNFNQTEGKTNIYFVCGLAEKKLKRCSDDDIITKKYYVVDIDIRLSYYEKHKKVLSQDELQQEIDKIIGVLKENWFWDYSYSCDSGNWLHLYYTWTERKIDKLVYSDWVHYIYEQIDDLISKLWYKCDTACSNIWRIMRLPWTINPRKKEKRWEIYRDLWDYECTILESQPQDSLTFDWLEEFAEQYKKEKEEDKKAQIKIKQIIKTEYKQSDNIWKEINSIPAYQIAEDIRWVTVSDKWLDNVALKEKKKNMWAYRYKPHNVIVNTGSSLIKTDKNYFTSYELVYYEYANQDKIATIEYFKTKYWIEVGKKTKIEIPKKEYKTLWFTYGWDCFDWFDCFMSGELVTVVAESNSGKTTFAMDIIKENSNKWRKCLYINLEFPIETVRRQRRLYLNNKKKRNLTDLDPLSDEEEYDMEKYIETNLSKFKYYNNPSGMELEELIELIIKYNNDGYVLFVIDTFSRITGNLDSKISHTNQNRSMEKLQDLCQGIWVSVINLHHTNKKKEFEWSQKIHDLSNVFITITKEEDEDWNRTTKYELSKDKFVTKTEIKTYRVDNKPSLIPPEKPF